MIGLVRNGRENKPLTPPHNPHGPSSGGPGRLVGIRAPFPYFGGKSRIAGSVWSYFGDVPNYIEPFCGSLAVLLARPSRPRVETVNDVDGLLVNAWRSIQWAYEETAKWADWPVTEIDYNSRHKWLRDNRERVTKALIADPIYCDPQAAGWWIWGANLKIRGRWCYDETTELPHLGNPGTGVNKLQLPHLGDPGKGEAPDDWQSGDGRKLHGWFRSLSSRLARVRILCGDWKRCLTPSVTTKFGPTAVFLDPPYRGYHDSLYSTDSDVFDEVAAWCRDNGGNPLFRIILCSYEGIGVDLPGWETLRWKAHKGYQKADSNGNHTGKREVLYISPHCLRNQLFEGNLS